MKNTLVVMLLILPFFTKCKKEVVSNIPVIKQRVVIDSVVKTDIITVIKTSDKLYTISELSQFNDSSFIALKKLDTSFVYDLKYASIDNFLNERVYECDDCLLRYKTAKQLIKINKLFKEQGYRIKFFDCYRPLAIQKKMWKIYPDKRYVANPEKGSNHNRGTAVDITLVDTLGNELAMGTDFDFFGRKAHHAYQNLPKEVLDNRKLLKSVMEANGFWSITSEWWHYNLSKSYQYKVSDFKTECKD